MAHEHKLAVTKPLGVKTLADYKRAMGAYQQAYVTIACEHTGVSVKFHVFGNDMDPTPEDFAKALAFGPADVLANKQWRAAFDEQCAKKERGE
jgi:hypothetical protein